jgi:hypothetical protein
MLAQDEEFRLPRVVPGGMFVPASGPRSDDDGRKSADRVIVPREALLCVKFAEVFPIGKLIDLQASPLAVSSTRTRMRGSEPGFDRARRDCSQL